MKKPNLSNNNYFPFYTRKITGEKKYYYCVETIMHLSSERGIFISIGYKQKRAYEIKIKRINDRRKLYDAMFGDTHITYINFAEDVNAVYRHISGAIRILKQLPAYRKSLIVFSTYFKFNSDMELAVDHWQSEITLRYDKFEYEIVGEKKVKKDKKDVNDGSEESLLMNRISTVLSVIEDKTTYKEITNSDFDKELDREWEYFTEYFEAPKFIRKSEYKPISK